MKLFKNKNTCAYLTPSNKSERGKNTHTMYLYKFPDKSLLKEDEITVFENIHILFKKTMYLKVGKENAGDFFLKGSIL